MAREVEMTTGRTPLSRRNLCACPICVSLERHIIRYLVTAFNQYMDMASHQRA
ncbi:hypothetical protein L210DRAFT_3526005, partial [Boletus edulis BED1]